MGERQTVEKIVKRVTKYVDESCLDDKKNLSNLKGYAAQPHIRLFNQPASLKTIIKLLLLFENFLYGLHFRGILSRKNIYPSR